MLTDHPPERDEFRLEQDAKLEVVERKLLEDHVLEPLARDAEDTRQWLDWQLASLVEGFHHEQIDVVSLSADERTSWERRATERGKGQYTPHSPYAKPYWLLDAGVRVGTIALDRPFPNAQLLGISDLYVRPSRRRCGIASRALRCTHEGAIAAGFSGLRIPTNWSWQPAVRFYTQLGYWILHWKDSLLFTSRRTRPRYRVEFAGRAASFSIERDGTWRTILEAKNDGERLGWTELPEYHAIQESLPDAYWHAPATFAVHLALAGWPLIRSQESWEDRSRWRDVGMPEGLALMITIFERLDREQGYLVRAPRIPGLDYAAQD
jgi:GNAT superfamily N-acetyltransferase